MSTQQVVRQNVTGLQWIAAAGWTTIAKFQVPRYMPYLAGTLGVAIRRGEIPGFKDFLLKTHPRNDPDRTNGYSLVSIMI